MADTTDHGWFSYSPLDPTSWDELTAEQRDIVVRNRREHPGPDPTCEVRVLFRSLQPGQAEIRFGPAPRGASNADVIRAAIRELESALTVFADR